jgi:transposase
LLFIVLEIFAPMQYPLPSKQLKRLLKKYLKVTDRRQADRLRVVIALARGNSVSLVASMFLISEDTVHSYFRLFKTEGINGLLEIHYEGRRSFLTDSQKEYLRNHLRIHLYIDVKSIIAYVLYVFGVRYSISGMTKLLHELNFEYKKPHLIAG